MLWGPGGPRPRPSGAQSTAHGGASGDVRARRPGLGPDLNGGPPLAPDYLVHHLKTPHAGGRQVLLWAKAKGAKGATTTTLQPSRASGTSAGTGTALSTTARAAPWWRARRSAGAGRPRAGRRR